jgi:hypothetical protein
MVKFKELIDLELRATNMDNLAMIMKKTKVQANLTTTKSKVLVVESMLEKKIVDFSFMGVKLGFQVCKVALRWI